MNKEDKGDEMVTGEERWVGPGCEAGPIAPRQSKTLILTQQDILIAFTSSSRAARSPDYAWCELTGRWTSWAERRPGSCRSCETVEGVWLGAVCVTISCVGTARGGKVGLKWCSTSTKEARSSSRTRSLRSVCEPELQSPAEASDTYGNCASWAHYR